MAGWSAQWALFWTMQALFVTVGALVLYQVATQMRAWVSGVPFSADEFYGSQSSGPERLEYPDGSHQVFRTARGGCGQPWYQLAHFLPAAAWAVLLPVQVTPAARKAWPAAHRWGGRAFLACSGLLGASAFVFPACGHSFSSLLDAPMSVMAAMFLVTAWQAYRHAAAGRIALHHAWVARHLGSGLGIYAMRVLFVVVFFARYPDPDAVPRDELVRGRQDLFGWSGIAGGVGCMVAAEAYVRLALPPKRSPGKQD